MRVWILIEGRIFVVFLGLPVARCCNNVFLAEYLSNNGSTGMDWHEEQEVDLKSKKGGGPFGSVKNLQLLTNMIDVVQLLFHFCSYLQIQFGIVVVV
ncbi:hypothetical protein GLYMA_03G241650v4 [Glycine max]|nr:hypothetical protein GLYMA_03G241650v4 [Glycine max]